MPDKADEELLADAYRDYRTRTHRRALGGGDQSLAPRAGVAEQADRVVRIWQRVFGKPES